MSYFCLFIICILSLVSTVDVDLLYPDALPLVSTTRSEEGKIVYYLHEQFNAISGFMEDDTFEIISIIGQARKGKSYTLSKIVQKMTGKSMTPFKSSNRYEPLTKGIWMYLLPSCRNTRTYSAVPFPCSLDHKPYLLLDIQGSYTEHDDEALRFAFIVTLISSQTFLFLHQKLYKYDVDQLRHIHTIIDQMNTEGLGFNLNDLNLGAMVREPFKHHDDLPKTVNKDLSSYSGYFQGFDEFMTVQEIAHFDDDNYNKSIENIIKYIQKPKPSRMKWISNAENLVVILNNVIYQVNHNADIASICIVCIFKNLLQWEPFGSWSACSAKCDEGTRARHRQCNTGRIQDCKQYIGGSGKEEERCNTFKCEWLPFGEWSECSTKCGGGTQIRERKCSTGSSRDCIGMFGGSSVTERACNTQECQTVTSNDHVGVHRDNRPRDYHEDRRVVESNGWMYAAVFMGVLLLVLIGVIAGVFLMSRLKHKDD
eukprot:57695_1